MFVLLEEVHEKWGKTCPCLGKLSRTEKAVENVVW